jgi:hypothetical protein
MTNDEIIECAKTIGIITKYNKEHLTASGLISFARFIEKTTREEVAKKIDIYGSTTDWAAPLSAHIRRQQ